MVDALLTCADWEVKTGMFLLVFRPSQLFAFDNFFFFFFPKKKFLNQSVA